MSSLDLESDVEQCDKLNPKTKERKAAVESMIDTILSYLKTNQAYASDDQIDPLLKSLQGHVIDSLFSLTSFERSPLPKGSPNLMSHPELRGSIKKSRGLIWTSQYSQASSWIGSLFTICLLLP